MNEELVQALAFEFDHCLTGRQRVLFYENMMKMEKMSQQKRQRQKDCIYGNQCRFGNFCTYRHSISLPLSFSPSIDLPVCTNHGVLDESLNGTVCATLFAHKSTNYTNKTSDRSGNDNSNDNTDSDEDVEHVNPLILLSNLVVFLVRRHYHEWGAAPHVDIFGWQLGRLWRLEAPGPKDAFPVATLRFSNDVFPKLDIARYRLVTTHFPAPASHFEDTKFEKEALSVYLPSAISGIIQAFTGRYQAIIESKSDDYLETEIQFDEDYNEYNDDQDDDDVDDYYDGTQCGCGHYNARDCCYCSNGFSCRCTSQPIRCIV